jgi:hypothetical protein
MAVTINASLSAGLVQTADTTGDLNLQSGGTTILAIASTGATIQGLTVGKGGGAVATNTAVGASALAANTTGTYNSAFGYQAMAAGVTTGVGSTSLGVYAGHSVTSGSVTAIGNQALSSNTTGLYNVAVGGVDSTGYAVLNLNSTGSSNTAIGAGSLAKNTTASNNTAVGYQAGYTNITGAQNVLLGTRAGYLGTNTSYKVMMGYEAGYSSSFSGDSFNTFIGTQAGYFITSGIKNTILGGYNGNQNGIDIRTLSNYVIVSDGDGNPTAFWDTRRHQASSTYYAGAASTVYYSLRGTASMSDNGGSGITSSNIFGGNVSTGFLHVNEVGTSKYLIAAIFKQNSTLAPVITVIASSGLSVSATNPGGTVLIGGATTGANVKMRYIAYDGQYSL